MGGGNLRALCQRPPADVGQQHRLAPVGQIHPVPGLEGHAPDIGTIPLLLRQADRLGGAEPLCLAGVQKCLVAAAVGLYGRLVHRAVIAVFPGGQELLFQLLKLGFFHAKPPLILKAFCFAFPPGQSESAG